MIEIKIHNCYSINMTFPTIIIINPLFTRRIRMKNQRPSDAFEMKIQMSHLTGLEYDQISISGLKDKPRFIKTYSTSLAFLKCEDGTEEVISMISMGNCRSTEVDNEAYKRMSRGPFMEGEKVAKYL